MSDVNIGRSLAGIMQSLCKAVQLCHRIRNIQMLYIFNVHYVSLNTFQSHPLDRVGYVKSKCCQAEQWPGLHVKSTAQTLDGQSIEGWWYYVKQTKNACTSHAGVHSRWPMLAALGWSDTI